MHEKFLQFDWLRAVVFLLNLRYLHLKITKLLRKLEKKKKRHDLDVIFGIHTTRNISKLSQISLPHRLVKLRITILIYHPWYLCQISLQK